METKEKKTSVKKFCQRFQISLNKMITYNTVKNRLGYRFYSDEQLRARQNFFHKDL